MTPQSTRRGVEFLAAMHPDEEQLDDYALGRIADDGQLAALEEHLLICEQCRAEVEITDAIRRIGSAYAC